MNEEPYTTIVLDMLDRIERLSKELAIAQEQAKRTPTVVTPKLLHRDTLESFLVDFLTGTNNYGSIQGNRAIRVIMDLAGLTEEAARELFRRARGL